MLSALIGFVVTLLIAAFVIWIVGRFNLGLEVDGFTSAIIAALVIAIVTWLVLWVLSFLHIPMGTGWIGAIVALIVSAIVLMISDKFVAGMKVHGFTGAIIASIAIGVINWLISLVL